ncbi:MAG: methionyl-tRNA formyltransferase, partial [Betaproteobacteria bacterium]|nr:methionyl-tRNA formyltransferase [Betaproteobacteria bacterium]
DGCAETGVTIMRMVPALDAGPAIFSRATPIAADETAGELQLRLSKLGAAAIVEALALIGVGAATETPQDDARATYAKKIERTDARLDFSQPAEIVARAIRAYDPKPGAWALHREGEVRLFGASLSDAAGAPGTVLSATPEGMVVACGTGAVRITEVHPAGKRRQQLAEWLRGRGVLEGECLS